MMSESGSSGVGGRRRWETEADENIMTNWVSSANISLRLCHIPVSMVRKSFTATELPVGPHGP